MIEEILQGEDTRYTISMRKLLEWCRLRGVRVELGNGSFYYPDKKLITLNWRVSKETQLFHLLHECGHHLIARAGGARYSAGNGAETNFETRLATFEEEFEAWYRGRRLAKRLGIKINHKRWTGVRRKCLAEYLIWTLG